MATTFNHEPKFQVGDLVMATFAWMPDERPTDENFLTGPITAAKQTRAGFWIYTINNERDASEDRIRPASAFQRRAYELNARGGETFDEMFIRKHEEWVKAMDGGYADPETQEPIYTPYNGF